MRVALLVLFCFAACTKGPSLIAYNVSASPLEVSAGDATEVVEAGRSVTFSSVQPGAALSVTRDGTVVERLTLPKAETAKAYVYNTLRSAHLVLVDYGPAYPCGKNALSPEKLKVVADLSEGPLVGLAQVPLLRDEPLPSQTAECGQSVLRVEVAPKSLGTNTSLEDFFADKLRREAALWRR